MIAKIAVDAAVYAIDKPYSYRVPPNMTVAAGMRVAVPFGAGNRSSEGIVLALEEGEEDGLKSIGRCLDETPLLRDEDLRVAAFVRERCYCTCYAAVRAMLPAGLWFRHTKRVRLLPGAPADTAAGPEAERLLALIRGLGGEAGYPFLKEQFQDEARLKAALGELTRRRLAVVEAEYTPKTGDKTERIAALAGTVEETMEYAARRKRSAPVQCAVLELLCAIGSGSTKEICYFTGASAATLRRLERLGYVTLYERPASRRPPPQAAPAEPLKLSAEQQRCFDGLLAQWSRERPGVALLYGVTGSGKTAVYLKLISHCLEQGKNALLLVPEIALTPQLLSLVAAHFGARVAALHSGLRVGERYDEWKRIHGGEARVVVGARSAVFAPLENLGLIIVDEEQEHAYKSEQAPRYHAREVALYRGYRQRALVVLGSATPSMESMYHAQKGDYSLYRLTRRYNGRALPEVRLADMKEELHAGNGSVISAPLAAALRRNVEQGRQAILLLNRRGASRYVVCVDCGEAPVCPRCSVHMTFHAANGRLMCHYCGHSEPLPRRCPQCGGHLKPVGAGTQRAVAELEQLLPGTEILRMDADTVSAAHSHEALLARFERERIPILVGTQMVAKGLNFENVTLVGVLDADMSLYMEDFRAAETTFSMLTQVVGRAGRGEAGGTALIQTMSPENAVLRLAAAQDYDRFYETEIELRRLRGSPPFRDLTVVTFTGLWEDQVSAGAVRFRDELGRALAGGAYWGPGVTVLGPAPAAVLKVNNRYRYRLTICCPNSKELRLLISWLLRAFAKDKRSRGVTAFADCNPYD